MNMWKRFLLKPLAFLVWVTLSPVVASASFCFVSDLPQAFDKAGAVFIGEITKVGKGKRKPANDVRGTTYLVEFKVEDSWKGTSARRITVLWRPDAFGCPYFAVGDVGERYLVYADARDSRVTPLEITAFNRTALAPSTFKPLNLFAWTPKEPIPLLPGTGIELNRRDASKDIEFLRRMRACECLLLNVLQACLDHTVGLQHVMRAPDGASADSSCCACWRQNMNKPKQK